MGTTFRLLVVLFVLQYGTHIATGQGKCSRPDIPNGSLYYQDRRKSLFDHGASLRFYCDPRHDKSREDEDPRCINGTWSFDPECIPNPCLQNKDIEGSQYTYPNGTTVPADTMVKHGVTLTLSCDPGYRLKSRHFHFQCDMGSWSPALSECEGEPCEVPPISGKDVIYKVITRRTNTRLNTDDEVDHSHGMQVVCDSDYVREGNAYSWCNLGTWDQVPRCNPQPCALEQADGTIYRSSDNRIINEDSIAHGERVTVECDRGYRPPSQSREVNCTLGQWSEPLETCAPVKCDAPELDLNGGQIVPTKGEYGNGETINIRCPDGHTLQGAVEARCLPIGWRWSSDEQSTCIPAPCPMIRRDDTFSEIRYSKNEESNELPSGTTARVTCAQGYVASEPRVVCRTGDWIPEEPICERPKSCGDPGDLLHGSRQGEVFTFGNDILLQCDVGYELRGTGWRVCQADGTWSGSQPTCQPVRCPILGPPDHGDKFGTEVTYASTVRFTCNIGYKIAGLSSFARSVVRRCEANGQWNGTAVRCTGVDCGSPGTLDNGAISYLRGQNTGYGEMVTFRCDANAELEGARNAVCEENEQWSNPFPTCWGKCSRPDVPNGRLYYQDRRKSRFDHGASLRFYCDYRHDKNREDEDPQCINGTWSFDPECILNPCRQNKDIEGSQYTDLNGTPVPADTMVRHGVTLTLSCDPGYRLKSRHFHFRCDRGSWSPALSECEEEPCEVPPISGKDVIYKVITRRTSTMLNTNDEVDHSHGMQVVCDSGYVREGNAYSWCNLGTWDQVPRCNPRPCQITSALGSIYEKNSRTRDRLHNGDSVEHGQGVRVRCESRYEIENGLQTRQCSFGKWLPGRDLPKCTGKPCALEQTDGTIYRLSDNRNIHEDSIAHGGRVTVECDRGYRPPSRSREVNCMLGQWSEPLETCVPVKCDAPELDMNGGQIEPTKGEYSYGETINILCPDGHTLQGAAEARCSTSGWRWSADEQTTCILVNENIRCRRPVIPYSQFQPPSTHSEFSVGSILRITCDEGHLMTSLKSAAIECLETGRWNDTGHACIKYDITYRVFDTAYYGRRDRTPEQLFVYKSVHGRGSIELTCRSTPEVGDLVWTPGNGREYDQRNLRGGSKLTIANPDLDDSQQLFCTSPSQGTGTMLDLTVSDATCEDPGEVPFSRRIPRYDSRRPRRHWMGANITYRCDYPYTLVGENWLVCQQNGQWSHGKPRCQLQ